MYEAAILVVAALGYYFGWRKEPLVFKFQYVFGHVYDNIRADWIEKQYATIEEYYTEEEEIILLCNDIERNRGFRNIGVTGIAVRFDGSEIFYCAMKKD